MFAGEADGARDVAADASGARSPWDGAPAPRTYAPTLACPVPPRPDPAAPQFPYLVDPLSAIQSFVHRTNPTAVVEGVLSDFNYAQIAAVAAQADTCVAFANADSGEGYITVDTNAGDRNNLDPWHSG